MYLTILVLLAQLYPHLTFSAPTNTTSIGATLTDNPAEKLFQSASPAHLVDDECPTPPTQFLPYPPPPGYQPGPGCPPASSGTQPSEFNPPPGVYGSSSSGSGSGSSQETSSQGFSMRGANPFATVLHSILPQRKRPRRGGSIPYREVDAHGRTGLFCEVRTTLGNEVMGLRVQWGKTEAIIGQD